MKLRKFIFPLVLSAVVTGGATAQEPATKVAPKTYKAYMVCNAHLDTQWNWDVQTTINEYIPRTLFQNLYLLERYPDYKFSFEGGIVYKWMKEYYPEQYAKLKKYIKEDRWHIAGASWDANDPNMPSAESFFRNILLGQEYYKREFGVKSTDIFLPDCFGFGYTLPTIAAHCGLIGFSTQKLSWRGRDFYDAPYHKKNPFSWGLWYGIDGSRLMAAFDTGGYSDVLPENVQSNQRLIERAANGYNNTAYRYYSGDGEHVGDMGNSGSVKTCRRLKTAIDDKTAPIEIISATSDQLFKDYMPFEKYEKVLPSYDGELLMDVHATGCYTSQSAMKYYNRRNEELAGAAEKASVAADWLGAMPYDQAKLTEIWQRFIWHQFHDDLTGTSIPNAYKYSWNDELIALTQSADVMNTAVGALSYSLDTRVKGTPVVVYNPVTYPVAGIVEVRVPLAAKTKAVAVYAPDGRRVEAQIVRRDADQAVIAFAADVASVGYAVYDVRPSAGVTRSSNLKVSDNTIENSIYKVTLDKNGDIASLFDKRYGKELVESGKAFRLALFEGNPSVHWPAWEVLKEAMDKEGKSVTDKVKISVDEIGAARASLKIERNYGDSKFTQRIFLTEGANDERIDISNTVDWHGKDVLLKAEFPATVHNDKAVYDLGIGFIARGNNTATAYEVPALKWADLSERDGSYGISILNDCKYGWDKPADNTLRLTLLHTPRTERNYPYQRDLDHGINHFTYSIIGHKNVHTQTDLVAQSEQLNMPLVGYTAPKHNGTLGRTFSMLQVSTPQIGVRALKQAEDGDGYIVRCYELTGKPVQQAAITFPAAILSAEECNGIEEKIGAASFENRSLLVSAGKFAPKTYRVRLAEPQQKSTLNTTNAPVALPYNSIAYTSDEFYTYYRFDRTRGTLAGELIPQEVRYNGIPFKMGEVNIEDAVKCEGQVIELPSGHTYTKLYLLAAAVDQACNTTFSVGDAAYSVALPLWKGFYGQWGWNGYSEAFMKTAPIGYIGTHRHQGDVGNLAYDYSYMYVVALDLPADARQITLPKDRNVVVFAMTASDNSVDDVTLASQLFIRPDAQFGRD
ncbi:MAG: glycoside hydrolase family 38 C-terminal domain-containing protein [Alistipes sp.]